MSERELLDRIRAVMAELDLLAEAAGANTKYYTMGRLERASTVVGMAERSLAWHVEGR